MAQRIGRDKFGNPQIVTRLRNKEGSQISGFGYAHVELGGKLYRISVSPCNEQKDENHAGWVSVTRKEKRKNVSM